MATVLLAAFVLAQLATLLTLASRNWWRGAPYFMAFLWVSCLQAIVGAVGYPHARTDVAWWHYVWMPIEVGVVLVGCAAAFEVLWKRSAYAAGYQQFSMRVMAPLLTCGLVGWEWTIAPHSTFWGWFVLAREWAWVGMTILVGIVVTFFAVPALDPRREPQSLVRHSWTFAALLISHSLIAPLVRRGWDTAICQHTYQAIVIVCCSSWLMLCCPASVALHEAADPMQHPDPDVAARRA